MCGRIREYHVAKNGSDDGRGTKEEPFLTISKAAKEALPGDTVIVHEGVYREWVKPARGGRSDIERIVYTAAKGEKAVIKGSERITGWENTEGSVWKVTLGNTFFGDYNPFAEALGGDWLIDPDDNSVHAGDVYLNGKSFYEAKSLEEVACPKRREFGTNPPWTKHPEPLLHPEDSIYQWFASVGERDTVIYANFHGKNPNEELTEISVRKCCFYPEKTGVNYITLRGFEIAQAACPWAPPTADQPGMVGPNWAKGWVIEGNIIHDAKCCGISLGKEASTGHNLCTRTRRKPGYQYQMEAVFLGRQIGWGRERVGSHTVRDNEIYDCGQNGIVGHMGCAFSRIEDNHIYNIAVKHEFFGYEIAGIKLHAAIDVQISHNHIHNCTLGTWLDWQAQGTRVSRNLYYANDRDLMVEVTHGPYLVDNNIFASQYNFDNVAQGGAYIHNLCCGSMRREPVHDRATPYHFAHSTEVAGVALVYGADDRIYQNIFLKGSERYTEQSMYGTEGYQGHPASLEEYSGIVSSLGNEDHEQFAKVPQPAYINDNAYFVGAEPYDREKSHYVGGTDPNVRIREDGRNVYLEMDVEDEFLQMQTGRYGTKDLGTPRITEALYENPDGTPIVFDTDYFGIPRGEGVWIGPFGELKAGKNRLKVWDGR